jgi:phosphoribosylformylglycinamidine synthase
MKKYESWDTFDFSNLSDQEIKKILSKQNIPLSIKETKTVQNEFLKRPPTLAELVLFFYSGVRTQFL